MKGINRFSSALVELISAIEWEYSREGQVRARNDAEQAVFELFVSKGYDVSESRKLAIHVCDAMEEP